MDIDKRVSKIERKMDEISEKLDVLLMAHDITGFEKISLKIELPSRKRVRLPKKVELDRLEKNVAKEIYAAGERGITAERISKAIGIGKRSIVVLIVGMRQKGIPLKVDKKQAKVIYSFERSVMEAQAKTDFLQLTK